MSTQVNTYIIIGYKFGYEEFKDLFENEDRLNEFNDEYSDSAFKGISNKNGLTVIFDGMSGDYVFLGFVTAKTGNFQHFEPSKNTIEIKTTKDQKQMVSGLINMALKTPGLVSPDEISTWVVSHYR